MKECKKCNEKIERITSLQNEIAKLKLRLKQHAGFIVEDMSTVTSVFGKSPPIETFPTAAIITYTLDSKTKKSCMLKVPYSVNFCAFEGVCEEEAIERMKEAFYIFTREARRFFDK